MSTVAEKSAARRAKILARSKDRMATVTGGMSASALPEDESASAEPLSDERAALELEKALEMLGHAADTPTGEAAAATKPATAAPAAAPPAASPRQSAAPAPVAVADPHEFLSSADAADFSPPPSPTSDRHSQQLSFAFSNAASASASAAARRRAMKDAAAYSTDVVLPPLASPLTLWLRRFPSQLRSIPPTRGLTVLAVTVCAVLAATGAVAGGMEWLLLIELLAFSATFLTEQLAAKKKVRPSKNKRREERRRVNWEMKERFLRISFYSSFF